MSKMKRVITHWTAGGSKASALDKKRYHRLVEQDGTIVFGNEKVEDNIVTSDGDYAAHTLNLNTGSIGIGMCGMMGAIESPFDAGSSPLTEKQFRATCILIADLCREYGIPVNERTVLTHAEVQHTLGVKQRGKWDISRLVFKPELIGSKACGDYMRQLVREASGVMTGGRGSEHIEGRFTLRKGMKSPLVKELQLALNALNFHVGNPDGDFGTRTVAGVIQFQTEHGLDPDGVVGVSTWAALDKGKAYTRKQITHGELLQRGSGTLKRGEQIKATLRITGLLGSAASVKIAAQDAQASLLSAQGLLDTAMMLLIKYWPLLLIGALGGIAVWWFSHKNDEDRLAKHNNGANIGR